MGTRCPICPAIEILEKPITHSLGVCRCLACGATFTLDRSGVTAPYLAVGSLEPGGVTPPQPGGPARVGTPGEGEPV